MNDKTKQAFNGFGVFLRFITPLLIGILTMMISWLHNDVKAMRVSLDNHLIHDTAVIKERLASIEESLEWLKKGGGLWQ